MGLAWGLRRPGDIISRPLPAHLAGIHSKASIATSATVSEGIGVTQRSMTSSSFSSIPKVIKYGSGKDAHVELVPQPSDDPEDPLNWPRWRKDLNLLSLLVMAGLVGGMKTVFISTAGPLSVHYRVSNTAIAALTAVPLVLSAVTGLICSVVAKFRGKRPVYLVSTLLLLIGTLWNMAAGDHYGSCLGARIFQGLGWGAFDVLVMASIQDTYFEHERNLPVSVCSIMTISATWGSPLLGGLASRDAGTFTKQFRIINGFYLLALPLLLFGAPETTFDRSRAVITPLPVPGLDAWRPWRLRHRLNRENALAYLRKMKPLSFKAPLTLSRALQAPRALVAPTTCLLVVLTFIPFGALWGLTISISVLTTPAPLSADAALAGVLMTGPWIFAALCVGGFSFYRGLYERFTRRVSGLILMTGSLLVLTGLLSYGLGIHNFMTNNPTPSSPIFSTSAGEQVSLPLLSLQLGILAGGAYILDTTTRPFVARSASFTSSSISLAHRSIGDMQCGVVLLRNFAAGIFVLSVPSALTFYGGLKAAAIGLGTTQVLITGVILVVWRFYEEAIWRADGLVMNLLDMRLMKESASFFETD